MCTTSLKMVPTNSEVDKLHNAAKVDGENLVTNKFPKIIVDITHFYQKSRAELDMRTDEMDFKIKYAEMYKLIKPLLLSLIDHCLKLQQWINLSTPKIEGGNNFGVEIQDFINKVISDVMRFTEDSYNRHMNYFSIRAKNISKTIKYPTNEDYTTYIKELDEIEYIQSVRTILQTRDHYSLLYDIIMKNLEKLKKPKSAEVEEGQADYYR